MILRRTDGSVILAAYSCIFNCNDALEAEIHALMQGMALAIQHSELPVIVRSDSSEALLALKGDNLSRSTYGHLVAEIQFLMGEREFIPSKIKRDQNRVAD
uniref:RNase H type-1 domain-containing protein n=1 Tax=Aegilops tauschii subsp. strangulata TaxID=200361 RepID=A0A453GQQ3_AEGTS